MGLWTKVAGIGLGVAGVVTANPALIAAGGSIVASDLAADGSKKAQATQEKASDEAMGVNTKAYDDTRAIQSQVYNQTRADLNPYMTVGSGAMGTLGSMVGLPPSSAPAAMNSAASGTSLGGMYTPPVSPGMPAAKDGAGASPQTRAVLSTQSAYSGQKNEGTLARAGGLVRLKAPDGSTRMVPQAKVPMYLEAGAVEV